MGRLEVEAASLGVVGLSKSQCSAMAAELDEVVDSFRPRPRCNCGSTPVGVDRRADPEGPRGRPDGDRVLPRSCPRVTADGCRQPPGIDVTSSRTARAGCVSCSLAGRPRPVRRRPW